MAKTNVALYGFSGTGKTAVAQAVARIYGMEVVDTDALIEKAEGATIEQIFTRRGEIYFRSVEREAVRTAAGMKNAVIATGGGVPVDSGNVAALSATCVNVLLRASVETIVGRLETAPPRPMLKGKIDADHVGQLLGRRQAAYRQFAHVIDTEALTVEEVARRVREFFLDLKDAGPKRRMTI